jgi:hypothetical protein
MERYYFCSNNGVTAVVGEKTYKNLQKYQAICTWFGERDIKKSFEERNLRTETACSGIEHLCVPTFTFTHPERASVSPWFTGDTIILIALIRHIKNNLGLIQGGSFYVPFSNGCEIGLHGEESMRSELRYVTLEQQFQNEFRISTSELIHKEE